jgi:hypothetical protein
VNHPDRCLINPGTEPDASISQPSLRSKLSEIHPTKVRSLFYRCGHLRLSPSSPIQVHRPQHQGVPNLASAEHGLSQSTTATPSTHAVAGTVLGNACFGSVTFHVKFPLSRRFGRYDFL